MSRYFEFFKQINETYPQDCNYIWNCLDQFGQIKFNRCELEDLWRDFSDEKYSAGFMSPDRNLVFEFANWLSNK